MVSPSNFASAERSLIFRGPPPMPLTTMQVFKEVVSKVRCVCCSALGRALPSSSQSSHISLLPLITTPDSLQLAMLSISLVGGAAVRYAFYKLL
jgi:hypothetical protein